MTSAVSGLQSVVDKQINTNIRHISSNWDFVGLSNVLLHFYFIFQSIKSTLSAMLDSIQAFPFRKQVMLQTMDIL